MSTTNRKKTQNKSEHKRRRVSARTPNQKDYIVKIKKNDVVICNGPAGTGKTHIAIGMAFEYLEKELVDRIIIARPVVEAGENLGFLPGDIEDKMSPYIQPIMDELKYYASYNDINTMLNSGALEICPLAYMRGRTFNNSFIICDECQNATSKQVEMLFTRLGLESKMVMTGDISQSDLNKRSQGAFERLCDCFDSEFMEEQGIAVVRLFGEDIVRNPKIGIMLEAWKNNLDKTGPLE